MAARKLHVLIYATIANCCLFLVVCGVALGTNKWFSTSTEAAVGGITVSTSYGLFVGEKTKNNVGSRTKYSLKIVCQGSNCMFSCGQSSDARKQDIEDLLAGKGEADGNICSDIYVPATYNLNNAIRQAQDGAPERVFINFGLYLATIAFIALGMIFAIVAGVLALYNTYRTPIQPVLSVSGLYVWNGIAAASILLAMIMWIIQLSARLRKNAAISDTLSGSHDSSGVGSLGISFWVLILAIIFAIANIGVIRYRTWKIVKLEENNVRVMTEKLESGDILLF
ncbi:Clarin-3 [Orchesella cincta]|uniref:Clarin-3 n=1 Tax=Orchesella cincta TaxID=48709 RepID=A0A1D2N6K8_ORCCI|nr:Clarin-3 [Orchesella cincta]